MYFVVKFSWALLSAHAPASPYDARMNGGRGSFNNACDAALEPLSRAFKALHEAGGGA